MFPWYVDARLVLLVIGAFGAVWSVGGRSDSAEPYIKRDW